MNIPPSCYVSIYRNRKISFVHLSTQCPWQFCGRFCELWVLLFCFILCIYFRFFYLMTQLCSCKEPQWTHHFTKGDLCAFVSLVNGCSLTRVKAICSHHPWKYNLLFFFYFYHNLSTFKVTLTIHHIKLILAIPKQ